MINAELLYKLKRAGCTYREVGVQYLPRRGGRATGAKLSVNLRAFHELFAYAHKWRREKPEEDSTGTDASHTLTTNHWNMLMCFSLKINEWSVSSNKWEKRPYTTEETDALTDALRAEILLQRAERHMIQAERKQQDA